MTKLPCLLVLGLCVSCAPQQERFVFTTHPVVTVIGEVRHEGDVGYYEGLTVSKAIAIVGGSSSGRSVLVTRGDIIQLLDINALGKNGFDPELRNGDVIEVRKEKVAISTQELP